MSAPDLPVPTGPETGTIVRIGDGIAFLSGLSSCMAGEVLRFPTGVHGLALSLKEAGVRSALLGRADGLKAGDPVWCTGRLPQVPCGPGLLGRVVDPLGQPLDDRGPVTAEWTWPLDHPTAGIAQRQPANVPLCTGLKVVDALFRIGRGSCQLILGDRRTGKTALAVDTLINQREERLPCVYVAIGQPEEAVARVVEDLRQHDALAHTTVVVARASDPVALRFLAPYAGCAIAEAFTYGQGRDTLCVYDDLTRHADAWRDLSLLLGRLPGPDGYPADLQYQHARLLERAVRRADRWVIVPEAAPDPVTEDNGVKRPDGSLLVYAGPLDREHALRHDLPRFPGHKLARVVGSGGSLTALAIVETEADDRSAPLPARLMELAGSRIELRSELFRAGVRPAVDVSSVVWSGGGPTAKMLSPGMHKGLKFLLLSCLELEAFAALGTELDRATQSQLDCGRRLREVLKQPRLRPLSTTDQAMVLYAAVRGFMDRVPLDQVAAWEEQFLRFMREQRPTVRSAMEAERRLTPAIERSLNEAIEYFRKQFVSLPAACG